MDREPDRRMAAWQRLEAPGVRRDAGDIVLV
jgi:hypothetical protein